MPTYEYECSTCGRFEAFQSIKDDALAECPTCHGPVRRLISAGGGLLFKGTGFYTTDYRNADYTKRSKEESGGASGTKEAAGAKPGAESGGNGKAVAGASGESPGAAGGGSSSGTAAGNPASSAKSSGSETKSGSPGGDKGA